MIEHDWLAKFIEHRVADAPVVRLIKKWLHAGVLEDGRLTQSELGRVQGGSISPLLANIYMHYAFDLCVKQWRGRHARGDVIAVRYADDWVAGFQYREDAERFKRAVHERLGRFGLKLHPDKTRLIEFGRFAPYNRCRRGQGKPDTFDFLGFTHCCGKTRKGKLIVLRITSGKRMHAKLLGVKTALRKCMHQPIAEQGEVPALGGGGRWPLLCRALQRGACAGLPIPDGQVVASHAVPPQSGQAHELEAHVQARCSLVAIPSHLPPVPEPASGRHDPRQEPYLVVPHVRICEGGTR